MEPALPFVTRAERKRRMKALDVAARRAAKKGRSVPVEPKWKWWVHPLQVLVCWLANRKLVSREFATKRVPEMIARVGVKSLHLGKR